MEETNVEKYELDERYTFENFVVGENNRFAHGVSLAVAEDPGTLYNPLFLYSESGLGKTHLMQSIASYIVTHDPKKRVRYEPASTFTNDLITSIRNGKAPGNTKARAEFKDKYRNIDVLLIDDVQFLIGKEATQEEFYHTFDQLYHAGKQIVLSSDKPPRDMKTLEEKLRTRFGMGIVAEICAPDFGTRLEILKRKLERECAEHCRIPEAYLVYIAENIKNSIRELEGALNKLIIAYKLAGPEGQVSFPEVEAILKDVIYREKEAVPTPEMILETVSLYYNVSVSDLKGPGRKTAITFPRQVCMYLMQEQLGLSLESIGKLLGGKNHSTVKYGVEKVSGKLASGEKELAGVLEELRKRLSAKD